MDLSQAGAYLRTAFKKDDIVIVVRDAEPGPGQSALNWDAPLSLRLGNEVAHWTEQLPLVARVVKAMADERPNLILVHITVDADDPSNGWRGRWVHPTQIIPFDPGVLVSPMLNTR